MEVKYEETWAEAQEYTELALEAEAELEHSEYDRAAGRVLLRSGTKPPCADAPTANSLFLFGRGEVVRLRKQRFSGNKLKLWDFACGIGYYSAHRTRYNRDFRCFAR